MVLLLKVFHRLLNYSFDTIVRGETLTALQQKSQKRISRHKCCLFTFICGNILFFAYGRRLMMFSFVVSKVQKEQGILLFVLWKLARESYVLGACLGSLFEILVAKG